MSENTVNIPSNGQHMKANWFCINCKAVGSLPKHYPNCNKKESYAIPASAEVPKKKANKKKWETFMRSFVFAKPIGYWFWAKDCWWYKNNPNKF